jgi:Acetyltransferase (GNAT) family
MLDAGWSTNPEALEFSGSGVSEGRTPVAVAADGTVLGFITGLPLEGSVLEVEDLFVDPNWMRRGVAPRRR